MPTREATPSARVAPDGTVTTVAGQQYLRVNTAVCGDGGAASQAQLSGPYSVAVGSDTSIYIGEVGNNRDVVRKVAPDGVITTIAGTGIAGFSGDGGPARLAQLSTPLSLAVGPDNTLYIDDHNRRVRRVDIDGIISTVAGTGGSGPIGDGGPAMLAMLTDSRGIAVGQDGSIYISDTGSQRVRRVTPDGIIRTIAGTGTFGFGGDGGPATQANFEAPYGIAVGRDDTVYIVDSGNNRVRWMRPDGTINVLAGDGSGLTNGDGGLARRAELQNLDTGLAVGPDGSVYVSQTSNNVRVRRIAPIAERFVPGGIAVPAVDGSEVYLFTPTGQHVRTLDAVTGALRYQFAYDSADRLASITDANANVTTIERDGTGTATAIVGPFGQRTTLATNADGFLNRVTNPAGEAVQLSYTSDGLLTSLTNPRGQVSHYTYDALGRLTSDADPTGAAKRLSRTGTNRDYTVSLTTALGRTTTYRVERLSNDDLRLTNVDSAGAQIQTSIGRDGAQTATYPDGTVMSLVLGPDPRWGMQAPLAASETVTSPGGTTQTTTTQRTVTLANPGDILNLRALTETGTINGRASTTAFDAPSRTFTLPSPTGRQTTSVVDDRGRLIREQLGDLQPSTYVYDARGRLATSTESQGAASRVTQLSYGSDGFLASATDPIGRTVTLTHDADGRVTDETLPDGRLVRFAYDADGNVSALTPPGRPDHTFSFSTRDDPSAYTPPTVGRQQSGPLYLQCGPAAAAHRPRRWPGGAIPVRHRRPPERPQPGLGRPELRLRRGQPADIPTHTSPVHGVRLRRRVANCFHLERRRRRQRHAHL